MSVHGRFCPTLYQWRYQSRSLVGWCSILKLVHYVFRYLEFDTLPFINHWPSPPATQEEQLRVALMNYLQRYLPDDHEKMQMVALKFGMFRELAKTTEEQAHRDLHRIKPRHLSKELPSREPYNNWICCLSASTVVCVLWTSTWANNY